jgi:hypothetical protein
MDAKRAATILMLSLAGTAHASDVPECTARELLGYNPAEPEITAHRRFTLPVIEYAHGIRLMAYAGGFALTLRIDAAGNVACFSAPDEMGEPQMLNDQRATQSTICSVGVTRLSCVMAPQQRRS